MAIYQCLWILFLILGVKGQSLNVALKSNGGSCTAAVPDMASNDDNDCTGAIDGFDSSSSNAFRFGFFGDPTKMWIKVTFREKYLIVLARFMQLFFAEETNFETIQMEFDSSPSQQFTFSKRADSYDWEDYALNPPVLTGSVNISVVATFSTTGTPYSGFSEVQFKATPVASGDMVTCPAHLSPVCFVLKASTQLPWQQADDACGDAYNGNLVTILDAATDGIIRDLLTNYTDKYGSLSGEVWIGGKREVEGQWRKISDQSVISGQGCYKDQASSRDLPLEVTGSLTSVTATNCVEECKSRGHLYAGVQNGNRCFCGNSFGKYGTEECAGIPCEGDNSEYCGGASQNFVYAVNGAFSAWNKDKPNYGTYQSCVVMQKSFDFEFDDERCASSHPFLCQIDGVHNSTSCSAVDQTKGQTFLSDGVCYYLGVFGTTWFQARMSCHQRGGKLAEVTSRETLGKLLTKVNEVGNAFSKIFIGYTNLIWYWSKGYTMLYSNFGSLKPDTESHSHLAIYDNFGQFQWTDADGDTAKHYICETGLPDAPTTLSTSTVAPSPIPTSAITTPTASTTQHPASTTTVQPSTSTTSPGQSTTVPTTSSQGTTSISTTSEASTSTASTTTSVSSTSIASSTTSASPTSTTSSNPSASSTSARTSTESTAGASTSTTAADASSTTTGSSGTTLSLTSFPSTSTSITSTTSVTTDTPASTSSLVETSSTSVSGTTRGMTTSATMDIVTSTSSLVEILSTSLETTTTPDMITASTSASASVSTTEETTSSVDTTSSATSVSTMPDTTPSSILPSASVSATKASTVSSPSTAEGNNATDPSVPDTSGISSTATPKPTFVQTSTPAPTTTTPTVGANSQAGAQTGGDSSELSVLEIVLIAVVCVLILIVVLVVIGFFCWKKDNRLNRVYVEDIYDGRSVAGLPSTGKLQYSYGSFNYGSQDALVPSKNTRASHLEDTAKYRVDMNSGSNSTLA